MILKRPICRAFGLGIISLLTGALVFAGTEQERVYQNPNRSLGRSGEIAFLSGPQNGEPTELARNFLDDHLQQLGLSAQDVADLGVSSSYGDTDSGIQHVVLVQRHEGLELFNALTSVNLTHDGRVINFHSSFYSNLSRIVSGKLVLDEIGAFNAAATLLNLKPTATPALLSSSGVERQGRLSRAGIASRDIVVKLFYFPLDAKRVRLAWNLQIEMVKGADYYNLAIDAETGALLYQGNFTVSESFGPQVPISALPTPEPSPAPRIVGKRQERKLTPDQYEVFEIPKEYPNDGPRTVVVNPADTTFSPFGWHDTNGVAGAEFTITRGNNANAYADRNDNDAADPGSQPDGGASLDFTGPLVAYDPTQQPGTYIPAAVTNLFYWSNIIHDVTARHGFTEASGNFQAFNYTGQGVGNDFVLSEAQDGADVGSRNNANFATPSDGQNPRMQMFLWTTPAPPERDGDFSSMIIAHEYGHGVSNRLTGGPANVNCLNNDEQMGEGWSDWLGLVLTANPTDTPTTLRGVGTWALSQPPSGAGIRAAPYTTDFAINGWTYDDIKTTSGPHPLGHIWASIIWEVYWELVNEHGFNPDIYGDWTTGGNNLALRLVLDGMKLQPCSPGFVDGRDAILLADQNLTGGANKCLLWAAFARRGLGFSATQGSSSSRTDGSEAFNIPNFCELLSTPNASASICAGSNASFTLDLGQAFVPPVNLSATGLPSGTNVAFSANPVGTVPNSVTMTIQNTGAAIDGTYQIQVTASDGVNILNLDVVLDVFNNPPARPTQLSPDNGTSGTSLRPLFTWEAGVPGCLTFSDFEGKLPDFGEGESVITLLECLEQVETGRFAGASPSSTWTLEIDDNSDFSSIDSTTVTATTSGYPNGALDTQTTYYWRVRGSNPCGDSQDSTIRSFTTGNVPSILLVDDDDNDPNMRTVYETLLNDLGLAGFQVWDTGNADNEPALADLNGYDMVVWFSGDEFGGAAGPGSAGQTALAAYLDQGGCLFMSSQDYFYDRGLTSFMTSYLGFTAVSNDTSQTTVSGNGAGIYAGLGPYSLNYPFSNFSDTLTIGAGGVAGFDGNAGVCASSKLTGNYATSFLAFPLETIPDPAARANVFQRFLDLCAQKRKRR